MYPLQGYTCILAQTDTTPCVVKSDCANLNEILDRAYTAVISYLTGDFIGYDDLRKAADSIFVIGRVTRMRSVQIRVMPIDRIRSRVIVRLGTQEHPYITNENRSADSLATLLGDMRVDLTSWLRSIVV